MRTAYIGGVKKRKKQTLGQWGLLLAFDGCCRNLGPCGMSVLALEREEVTSTTGHTNSCIVIPDTKG